MGTLINTFHDAIAARAEAALVSFVARQPKTTVAELAELLAANPALGSTTLAALTKSIGSGSGGGARASEAAPAAKRRGRPPGRKNKPAAAEAAPAPAAAPGKRKSGGGGGKRNVRTEAGREQFDQDVLAALAEAGGDSVSATTLRGMVGGDPNQLRAALNRLIEGGAVTFTGKARGTRYSLAERRRTGAPGHFITGS